MSAPLPRIAASGDARAASGGASASARAGTRTGRTSSAATAWDSALRRLNRCDWSHLNICSARQNLHDISAFTLRHVHTVRASYDRHAGRTVPHRGRPTRIP
eukprot:6194617-Prymnesium_polylepis.1